MTLPVSPLAPPAGFPDVPPVKGVRFATAAAGVKYEGRDDVMLAVMDGATVAGVFTKSATRSAPVLDCQAKLSATHGPAAFLVNAGNSNAFTGRAGESSVNALCEAASDATGIPADRVFTASTGVIGERLPHDKIIACLNGMAHSTVEYPLEPAARAIMTTDTFPKGAFSQVILGDQTITIAGFAKGSGMIAPDMATMLVYLFTDAGYDGAELQTLLSALTERTFNCITVDSDTSTSDTLMLAATGAAGVDATGNGAFSEALERVMRDLAHQVVRDGEGATKFVEITCQGAANNEDARRVAMAIANSPLVKTAIAGEDPNWGRIVMAVGKSGAQADRDKLGILFGNIRVAEGGWVAESYTEHSGAEYMRQDEIEITVELGVGAASATVWTCDLSHQYITI
ncbi:MAG: bifunctional glutamate N-acetyltransferase/amino-acid acetyltransferase ArgJ [Pseudomonadota bacterium]